MAATTSPTPGQKDSAHVSEHGRRPLRPRRNLKASGKPRKGGDHSSGRPSARGHGWHPAWTQCRALSASSNLGSRHGRNTGPGELKVSLQ